MNNTQSKLFFLPFLMLVSGVYCFGQSSAVSKPKTYNIVKEVKPPILGVDDNSIVFVDASGNNAIDANESSFIKFSVSNSGYGAGYNCRANVSVSGSKKGVDVKDVDLPVIPVGKSVDVIIPITSGMNTEDGKASFSIKIYEPNGFGTDVFTVDVPTKSFDAPLVKVSDYAVVGTSGSLKKMSQFTLQVLVQNIKYGSAEDVKVDVIFPDGIFVLNGDQYRNYNVLKGGEAVSLEYSLIANNNYSSTSIPVTVNIHEKHGKYSENKIINLQMNQTLASNKISVKEVESAPRDDIRIASIGSDVDKNIPVTSKKSTNTFAVIIANENYRNDALVDYARNDGTIFKAYCEKALGIPSSNVRLMLDATLNDMKNGVSWLKEVADAYNGDAKVILYYAGHGVPDESSKESYLLPVDGDGRRPSLTGLSLEHLYSELSSFKTNSTLVFMDACFSGAKRDGGMLASARGVVIKAKDSRPLGNMVVLSAATGEQTAYKYDEHQHGMFTYFLLKKIQESKGDVTMGDLSDYVISNVKKNSIVQNSKSQVPTVMSAPLLIDSWTTIKL